MPAPLFRSNLISKVLHAESAYRDLRDVDHSGLKGALRELVLQHLLDPILPPGMACGTGAIIDSTGAQSAQTDIVLYSKAVLPPILHSARDGMFPVEACVYSIEVKSRLTSTELTNAIEKAGRLGTLRYLEGKIGGELLSAADERVTRVIPALFAFESDLSVGGKTELDRYRSLDPGITPSIPVICVLGRGYWWFDFRQLNDAGARVGWVHAAPREDHGEVVDFIAGVGNTLPRVIEARGAPPLGRYLASSEPFLWIGG